MNADDLFRNAQNRADTGDERIRALERAVARQPDDAESLHELGLAYHSLGRMESAFALLASAADQSPHQYRYQYNIAVAFRRAGRINEAIVYLRRATALPQADPDAFNVLGNCLREIGELDAAIAAFRRAINDRPNFPFAWNNLGTALQDQGKLDEAIESFRTALHQRSRYPGAHSNLLLCLNYHDGWTDERVCAEHKAFGQLYGAAVPMQPHPPRADGRIRIGYLSPDFRQHSLAFFIWPILANHDRSRFHITCYSDVAEPDAATAQLQRLPEVWRTTAKASDDEFARLVAADQIDILVDLAGHTGRNRLPLLAGRIAPIQVTYLGYPNTTGIAAMDYRLTDAVADPPGQSDTLHSEALMRLPHAFFCFLTPADLPDVVAPPALSSGRVTFAVFTNHAKVRPVAMDLWSRVLHAVPGSRLLLQAKSLRDAATRDSTEQFFADRRIGRDRLELRPWVDFPQYIQLYSQVDIILDTFPFAGHTTSCQAMWMGVPVVTLAGATHRARMGASLMINGGFAELVAHDEQGYVDICVGLARDQRRLAQLREEMRPRLLKSPIMNARQFARDLEAAYIDMIKRLHPTG